MFTTHPLAGFALNATEISRVIDTQLYQQNRGSQFFIRASDKPLSVAVSASNPDSSHAGKKC